MNEDDRWTIQWVRDYRQFVVLPPAEWDGPDPFEDSFDTLAEAMNWIDRVLIKAPGDSVVPEVIDHAPPERTLIPARHRPEGADPAEPARQYSAGENVNPVRILNPIAEQDITESKRERIERYSGMVGL